MYSELNTQSKEEATRFLVEQLDHKIANVTIQKREDSWTISVGSGLEPPVSSS